MHISRPSHCFAILALMLLVAAQPAWALGDAVIPQAFGVLVGGPVLIALFIGVLYFATKGSKASPIDKNQWWGVVVFGSLFNGVWLCLLIAFDPGTYGWQGSWTEAGFVARYVLPTIVLVAFICYKDFARRGLALAASCLLIAAGYWFFFTLPEQRAYEALRAQEMAAAPDGSRQKPYQQVDIMPEFVGGQAALDSAIQREIQYPSQALELGAEGTVRVEYTVLPDSSLVDVRAVEGVDAGYHEEAERIVRTLPHFSPGRHKGVPVAVAGMLRIAFTIPENMKAARLKKLEREKGLEQMASWSDTVSMTPK